MIRTRRAAPAQSGGRFFEKIMLKQKAGIRQSARNKRAGRSETPARHPVRAACFSASPHDHFKKGLCNEFHR
jgi:hypothetical protein